MSSEYLFLRVLLLPTVKFICRNNDASVKHIALCPENRGESENPSSYFSGRRSWTINAAGEGNRAYGKKDFVCTSVIQEASPYNLRRSVTGNPLRHVLHGTTREIMANWVIYTSDALI